MPSRPVPRSRRVLGSGTTTPPATGVMLPGGPPGVLGGVMAMPPLPPLKPLLLSKLLFPAAVTPPVVTRAFSQPVEMVLVSMVTSPMDAKALPQLSVAPVPKVMLAFARIFPANVAPAPIVAEPAFGITQNTLSFAPTFSKATVEPVSAVSELPIRKMKDASVRFPKSRVSVPVRSNVDPVEKTPGKSVTVPAV